MLKDEIEILLKQAGWKQTVSAPPGVVDFQDGTGKRVLIFPEEFKYVTKAVLDELMLVKDSDKRMDIIEKAKKEYEATQGKLITTKSEADQDAETRLRITVKNIIDKLPIDKVKLLAQQIKLEETLDKLPLEEIDNAEPELTKKPIERVPPVDLSLERTHISSETEDSAEQIRIALLECMTKQKDFKSAIVTNTKNVRTVKIDYNKKGGKSEIVFFHTIGETDAQELVFVLDGVLQRELEVRSAVRTEKQVIIEFQRTGWKREFNKKRKRSITQKYDDFGNPYLVDETGRVVGTTQPRFKKPGEE